MKKLIFKIILLVSPFAFILIFVEHRLRGIPNTYLNSKTELEKRHNEIEILITGASHAQSGIAPQFLSHPAFNLANGSQSLYYDTQLITKYTGALPKLKLVIFTISYHSLESQLKNSMERWRGGFYKQVFGIRREDEGGEFQLADYSYIGLYSPKLAYRQVLEDLLKKNKSTEEVTERAVKAANQGDISPEFGKRRVKLHETEMRENSVTANVEALEQACRLLKERNVMVAFITIPAHHTYSDNIQPEKYQRMQEIIKQLSKKNKTEYFNYMFDTRFTEEDFINSDHLSETGAEKFTKIIDQEIVGKYLKN